MTAPDKFVIDLHGRQILSYHCHGYDGPAVRASDHRELQDIIRETDVNVDWHDGGLFGGFIVFPEIAS